MVLRRCLCQKNAFGLVRVISAICVMSPHVAYCPASAYLGAVNYRNLTSNARTFSALEFRKGGTIGVSRMRKQVIAVVTAILLGTATMTTGAMAFGRGGGFGHGASAWAAAASAADTDEVSTEEDGTI